MFMSIRTKKAISFFLLTMTMMLYFSSVALAANSEIKEAKKVVFKNTEIKDINTLLDRAQKNISDIPKEKFNSSFVLTNDKLKIAKNKDTLVTTQLLEESVIGDSTVKEYATTIISIVTRAMLTQYDSNYDSSYGVMAYSTIYWNTSTINNLSYATLTSSSGGWTIYDASISISNRYVRLGASGIGTNGLPASKTTNHYPIINTYTFAASSFPAILTTASVYSLGNTTTATLTRYGTTWTIYHYNNYTS
jgi:hypothetical protein